MNIKITAHEGGKIDLKRFYPPFDLTANCPHCGEEVTQEGDARYLMYPGINIPIQVDFYHELAEVRHEWEERIILRVTAEPESEGDRRRLERIYKVLERHMAPRIQEDNPLFEMCMDIERERRALGHYLHDDGASEDRTQKANPEDSRALLALQKYDEVVGQRDTERNLAHAARAMRKILLGLGR